MPCRAEEGSRISAAPTEAAAAAATTAVYITRGGGPAARYPLALVYHRPRFWYNI